MWCWVLFWLFVYLKVNIGDIGAISKIQLELEDNEESAAWYLEKVSQTYQVQNLEIEVSWHFFSFKYWPIYLPVSKMSTTLLIILGKPYIDFLEHFG